MTVMEKLREDRDGIYIGNLFTVDADLTLPSAGKNGSQITWESEFPHLIDSEGKVHRPRAGNGNRELTLTATLSLEGEHLTRTFAATVLQMESNLVFVRAMDVEAQMEAGEAFHLPSVAILELDDGNYTTLPVQWKNAPDFAALAPGKYEVEAEAPDARYPDIAPKAVVSVVAKGASTGAKTGPVELVQPFALHDVHIDGGIFAENKGRMQQFLLGVDDDSMLYNFRVAAGLDTKGAQPMTGWDAPECHLKGHTTGHYLSAIALACCNGEQVEAFHKKVDYMIDDLARCQDAMAASGKFHPGFLSGYSEEQFDLLEEYVCYPKIWAPWYTLHKIMAGLLDCYEFAGNEKALDVCKKLGLWAYERLEACGEERRQKMWSMYIAGEFGGMNEVMARLYGIDPKAEYLTAAKYFDNEKLFWPMRQNIDTLGGIHANQHIPQVIGALEIYRRGGGDEYYDIAQNFWQMVCGRHIYCIGGTGEGEMFQKPDGIGAFLTDRTAESCASYNMLKLTARLFAYTPRAAMMDYYEKALVNHIVASHDQSGPTGGSTYFMPLEPGGEKHFDLTENSCCHGTGLESHLKYGESIYYHAGDTLYVALYVPSTLCWREKGMTVTQAGNFIDEEKVVLHIAGGGHMKLALRLPGWLETPAALRVNGRETAFAVEDGFAAIERDFADGDTVELALPFTLRCEATPDKPDIVSVYYGPLVLAAADGRKEFLQWPKGMAAKDVLKPAAKPQHFLLGDVEMMPNYNLQHSAYHVYLQES